MSLLQVAAIADMPQASADADSSPRKAMQAIKPALCMDAAVDQQRSSSPTLHWLSQAHAIQQQQHIRSATVFEDDAALVLRPRPGRRPAAAKPAPSPLETNSGSFTDHQLIAKPRPCQNAGRAGSQNRELLYGSGTGIAEAQNMGRQLQSTTGLQQAWADRPHTAMQQGVPAPIRPRTPSRTTGMSVASRNSNQPGSHQGLAHDSLPLRKGTSSPERSLNSVLGQYETPAGASEGRPGSGSAAAGSAGDTRVSSGRAQATPGMAYFHSRPWRVQTPSAELPGHRSTEATPASIHSSAAAASSRSRGTSMQPTSTATDPPEGGLCQDTMPMQRSQWVGKHFTTQYGSVRVAAATEAPAAQVGYIGQDTEPESARGQACRSREQGTIGHAKARQLLSKHKAKSPARLVCDPSPAAGSGRAPGLIAAVQDVTSIDQQPKSLREQLTSKHAPWGCFKASLGAQQPGLRLPGGQENVPPDGAARPGPKAACEGPSAVASALSSTPLVSLVQGLAHLQQHRSTLHPAKPSGMAPAKASGLPPDQPLTRQPSKQASAHQKHTGLLPGTLQPAKPSGMAPARASGSPNDQSWAQLPSQQASAHQEQPRLLPGTLQAAKLSGMALTRASGSPIDQPGAQLPSQQASAQQKQPSLLPGVQGMTQWQQHRVPLGNPRGTGSLQEEASAHLQRPPQLPAACQGVLPHHQPRDAVDFSMPASDQHHVQDRTNTRQQSLPEPLGAFPQGLSVCQQQTAAIALAKPSRQRVPRQALLCSVGPSRVPGGCPEVLSQQQQQWQQQQLPAAVPSVTAWQSPLEGAGRKQGAAVPFPSKPAAALATTAAAADTSRYGAAAEAPMRKEMLHDGLISRRPARAATCHPSSSPSHPDPSGQQSTSSRKGSPNGPAEMDALPMTMPSTESEESSQASSNNSSLRSNRGPAGVGMKLDGLALTATAAGSSPLSLDIASGSTTSSVSISGGEHEPARGTACKAAGGQPSSPETAYEGSAAEQCPASVETASISNTSNGSRSADVRAAHAGPACEEAAAGRVSACQETACNGARSTKAVFEGMQAVLDPSIPPAEATRLVVPRHCLNRPLGWLKPL